MKVTLYRSNTMSITRWNSKVHTDFNFEDSVYHYEHKEGEYVLFSDHLEEVTSLEYDIRYEREQKEELQEELRCTKAEYGDIIYRLEERITELEDEVKSI